MVDLLGFYSSYITSVLAPCSATAAVLRLGHVLSHGVAMFGGLVGGGGLWWMGTRGQGVGDGHSPGHQPLHRPGNPAGGNAHHTRREPANRTRGDQHVWWRAKIKLFIIYLKVTTTGQILLQPSASTITTAFTTTKLKWISVAPDYNLKDSKIAALSKKNRISTLHLNELHTVYIIYKGNKH